MKVVSAKEMVRAESSAIAEGASGADFMEAAGKAISEIVQQLVSQWGLAWRAVLLCGSGNNTGDAYVVGRYLLQLGYSVEALQLTSLEKVSDLCRQNHELFLHSGGTVQYVTSSEEISFPEDGVIVDGILGTGFHGKVEGLFAEVIDATNRSPLPTIAIDIPSGLNGTTGAVEGSVIEAVATCYMGLPKSGFFMGDAWNFAGRLIGIDFGMESRFLEDTHADLLMVAEAEAAALLPPMRRNRHKYDAGAVAAFAGSPEMPGAALLASWSVLRAGAGLVRLYHPKGMEAALAAAPAEVIRVGYSLDQIAEVRRELEPMRAILIGPGLGCSEESCQWVEQLLQELSLPCVLDADALNLLAKHIDWPLPEKAILTPHAGEFRRLVGASRDLQGSELLDAAREFSTHRNCTLVLKGAPTFVFHPNELPTVIPVGDPGMATAGSGDVLTGILAALLAQGMEPWDAARLGVYLHGRAGELAAEEFTSRSMTASDIIEALPDAFRLLERLITANEQAVTPRPGWVHGFLSS